MSANYRVFGLTPRVLQHGLRGTRGRSRPFDIASSTAVALVARSLTTDTNTPARGNGTYPPPGYDAREAKKPLPRDEHSSSKTDTKEKTQAEKVWSEEAKSIKFPKDQPTAHAKTKAEEQMTLAELALSEKSDKSNDKNLSETKKEKKKLSLMEKIKKEVVHYWDGTKLLAAEVKISTKLAFKMAAGYELTRRENRQVSICCQVCALSSYADS